MSDFREGPESGDYVVKQSDMFSLHRFLADHAEKIGRVLAATTVNSRRGHVFEELTTQLSQLGDPPRSDSVRSHPYF